LCDTLYLYLLSPFCFIASWHMTAFFTFRRRYRILFLLLCCFPSPIFLFYLSCGCAVELISFLYRLLRGLYSGFPSPMYYNFLYKSLFWKFLHLTLVFCISYSPKTVTYKWSWDSSVASFIIPPTLCGNCISFLKNLLYFMCYILNNELKFYPDGAGSMCSFIKHVCALDFVLTFRLWTSSVLKI
jgi:hypothetical protein